MSRHVLVALALVATIIPFLPASIATSCGQATQAHVGNDYPSTPTFYPDCCVGPTLPVGDYYVNLRAPVQAKIWYTAHPNGGWITDTSRSLNNWVNQLENHTIGTPSLPGTDPSHPWAYGPFDVGSYSVAAEPTTPSAWIYEETNGLAGLQKGGTNGMIEDPCVDILPSGTLWHDTVVL